MSLDGVVQPLPLTDAVLTAQGTAADFEAGTPLVVTGSPELVWTIQQPRLRVARWEIAVFADRAGDVLTPEVREELKCLMLSRA